MLYAKEQITAIARRGVSQHLLPDAPDPLDLLVDRTGEAVQARIVWFTPFESAEAAEDAGSGGSDADLRHSFDGFAAAPDERVLARRLGVFAEVTILGERDRLYRLRRAQVRVQNGAATVRGLQRTRFCSLEHRWTFVGAHDHRIGALVDIDLSVPELTSL